ncbi:BREX system serine/threonine kinase PglW [Actinomadura miaoliensis]|uniref:BREX system serine/threonine kinase PglW n=1 Tax=Actinomadura miaoliensis TaxID=430685 RepID=A0ABP7W5Q2_9ACTN
MTTGGNRWWGARSDFPWERDALEFVRRRMRDEEPFRAWSAFTFTAQTGHVREVDLFIVTPAGLFLVEIKSHPGRLVNSGGSWMFEDQGRVRTIDNPLHLADRKAKELKGRLEWAVRKLGIRGLRIPYIQAVVFLSAPGLRSELDEVQRLGVYAREQSSGLPRIWEDLLDASPRRLPTPGEQNFSRQLPRLMDQIGVQLGRRHRTVGTWKLQAKALDAGPTWEDYLAENAALEGDHRRVRIYLSELGAGREARESTRRAARREYLVLQGIDHPGIIKAEQFSDDHEAGPAIVFPHQPEWLRLDHYMAQYGDGLDVETRLDMIRQLAEALAHAHRRHLYHRALAARSVYVAFHGAGYDPKLKIIDWQAAARPGGGSSGDAQPQGRTSTLAAGVPSLVGHIERSAEAYLAPEFNRPDAESVPLDVFGLGALAYLVVTGRPPADSRSELGRRLAEEQALSPSAVEPTVTPRMDELVRRATRREVYDRTPSVREFLEGLDEIEAALTAPAPQADADPLEAVRGTVVAGWTVQRNLGKGSTSRAFLVERQTDQGRQRGVLKVALTEAAATRLQVEADLLGRLHDSHIVQLIDPPCEVGDRTVLVLEEAGQVTLAEYIRRDGRMSIDELELFGDQLFAAARYLEEEGVRHRDIKPDNLAIRRLANNSRRLVLFDFSHAQVPDTVLKAGTPDYLDPFLGTGQRSRYDDHAERYAIAVTLHEMASAELPSWGDGMYEPEFIDRAEDTPQLAEDRFDAGLRDGLVAFFDRALHRDVARRFGSLKQMRDAWRDMFRELDQAPPPTSPSSTEDDSDDVVMARENAAKAATPETMLAEAGLSQRALSAAVDELGVATVGELMVLPATRIHRLRTVGVGSGPRNELARLARDWRERFKTEESAAKAADEAREAARDVPVAGSADAKERLKRLSLDEIAGRLVPKETGVAADIVSLALALPGRDNKKAPLDPWAPQRDIADHLQVGPAEVAEALKDARRRWTSDSAIKPLRDDVVDILTEQGRILEAEQLAAELLARRGSSLTDPDARAAVAGAAVRVALETEERLDEPRLAKRRTGPGGRRVLVALRASDDADVPSHIDLFDYAEQLGERADELATRDPLPSAVTVKGVLREVVTPPGMALLPDTRLVALAAAASTKAAVTARLELYPVDLAPARAVELAQITGHLGGTGITAEGLRRRVLARFPRLTTLPTEPDAWRKILNEANYQVEWAADGRNLIDRRFAESSRTFSISRTSGLAATPGRRTADRVTRRLETGIAEGGFLALKTRIKYAVPLGAAVAGLPGVTPIDVTTEFVTALREIVTDRGRPTWETMLEADPDTAPPVFHLLIDQALRRVETKARQADGIALLLDATPLARYKGGADMLARLMDAARDPGEKPHGLWLLCPMEDPHELPLLDRETVPVITDNEHLTLPPSFGQADEPPTRRAS